MENKLYNKNKKLVKYFYAIEERFKIFKWKSLL